jgi:xylan 1,4-beta-xylosidase
MGSPTSLSAEQLRELQNATRDIPEVRQLAIGPTGAPTLRIPMRANDVVLIVVKKPSLQR